MYKKNVNYTKERGNTNERLLRINSGGYRRRGWHR